MAQHLQFRYEGQPVRKSTQDSLELLGQEHMQQLQQSSKQASLSRENRQPLEWSERSMHQNAQQPTMITRHGNKKRREPDSEQSYGIVLSQVATLQGRHPFFVQFMEVLSSGFGFGLQAREPLTFSLSY